QPVVKKEIIYPDQKQMLAVFKFENVGKEAIELDYGQVVAHNLNKEIALANFFDVRDKSRVEEVLDKLELKNKSINLEQAVKAGKELTLESAIIGSVSKLKDTIDIDVRVVNILNGKDICTFYEKISEESQIRETCKDIVKKIMLYYSENNDFNLKTPANLKTKSEIKSITLSWKPNQEKKLAGYYIYRSESADGDYEYVGETDKSLFTDQDLDPGKTYYYKVASVNIFGYESELSIFNSAQPLPPPELDPVQNVEIISEAVPVELKWDKMKEQIAGYRIYRTDGEGEEFKKLKEIKDNSYRDEDVQAFKTYQYKVTAFNNDIESKLGSSSALTVVVKELWESLKEDNFRKGPSSKTEIIKKMPKGEKFYFSGEKKQVGKNNAYLKIKTLDGTEGWFWMASAKKLK
ncbi:MAG: hypothetical protein JW827_12615, partial [Spirochaetes bacterium]|nr:hypothetical protein [Spirochaetota bacterium]